MTRGEFIKRLEEVDRILLEEVDLELTDYARCQTQGHIQSAINFIRENEYRQYY